MFESFLKLILKIFLPLFFAIVPAWILVLLKYLLRFIYLLKDFCFQMCTYSYRLSFEWNILRRWAYTSSAMPLNAYTHIINRREPCSRFEFDDEGKKISSVFILTSYEYDRKLRIEGVHIFMLHVFLFSRNFYFMLIKQWRFLLKARETDSNVLNRRVWS